MDLFCRQELHLASKVLLSRLTRPKTVEIDILFEHLIDPSSDISVNIERSIGRSIGCFSVTSDDTACFYLAVRADPDDLVTHVFVYYLNRDHNCIQDDEMEVLKRYIPSLNNVSTSIKFGVINIRCRLNPKLYLSMFLEAIDYTLGPQLVDQFLALRVINIEDLINFPSTNNPLLFCEGKLSPSCKQEMLNICKDFGYNLSFCHDTERLHNPSVVLYRFHGHLIGIIFHEDSKTANYITVHPNQVSDEESFAELKSITNSWFDHELQYHLLTRLSVSKSTYCYGNLIRYAFWLALNFKPHVLAYIKENELLYLCEGKICHKIQTSPFKTPRSGYKAAGISSRRTSSNNSQASQTRVDVVTNLRFSGVTGRPELLKEIFDSQMTELLESRDIYPEISFWKEVSKQRQRIRDSIVPPIHYIKPLSDFTQSYLMFLPCYTEAVRFMAKLWNNFATTIVMFDKYEVSNLVDPRFIIYSNKTSTNLDFLLIVDQSIREWIYLQPENSDHKDGSYFEEITRRYCQATFPHIADYNCRSVPIVHGNCHKGYTRLHLLMSLYVLTRLFRYSVSLPQKIIYGEFELRKYAASICTQLQLNNSEYNIEKGLIDDDGYLKEGAKESLPSPLRFEPTVVPKDQCMFCKKRGFNNLGRHMSMKHGGQALAANLSR